MNTVKINIALYRGTSWISKAIRFMSWGIYSHASIVMPDGTNYESWDGVGVRSCPNISYGHTPKTRVDFFEIEMQADQLELLECALQSQLGKKYDYKGVLRFCPALRFFMRDSPSKREQARWFCSEYVCWALEEAGIILLNKPCWKISPSDIPSSPIVRYTSSAYT